MSTRASKKRPACAFAQNRPPRHASPGRNEWSAETGAAGAGTQAATHSHDVGARIDRLYFGLHHERTYRLRVATPLEEAMRRRGAPALGYTLMTIAKNQGPNLLPARVTVFCLPPQPSHQQASLLADNDGSCAPVFAEIMRRNGRGVD